MQHSKLTHFFTTLPPGEFRWFRDFVASPYFNRHDDPVQLCDYYIQLARRQFPAASLERQRVFQKVFPDSAYEERRLAYAASALLKLGERFLAQRHFEADALRPALYTLYVCASKGLEKSYALLSKKIETELASATQLDAQHYYRQYQWAEIAEIDFAQRNLRHPAYDYLSTAARSLDAYYLIRRLSLACSMIDRMKMLPAFAVSVATEPLRMLAAPFSRTAYPALDVYLHLLDLLEADADTGPLFTSFYDTFLEQARHFPASEQRALCYMALNYQLRLTIVGDQVAATRMLSVYEEGLRQGFLLEDGKLSPWDFKNITKLGLGLRRFEWVTRFSGEYVEKLPEDQRQDAYHFNLADLSYHQQDYDRSLTHLNQVEFTDIHYNLGAKAMLLKIYFETGAEEAFSSLAASFRLFLKRNKTISSDLKNAYLNFITLALLIHKKGKTEATVIRERIQQTAEVNARSWLLKQVQ